MRSILKSSLGRASTIIAIVGLALSASVVSAEARNGYWDHWGRWHYAPVYRGWHSPYYGYHTYYGYAPYYGTYAPPVVYGPPAYYGPPSVNFTIPLG
jgi:hypothetical protein